MELGAFSVSLAVKDIDASREFYEQLGFSAFHGEAEQGWLMMRNGSTVIGLFQGMFEHNLLTFNPGWDQDGQEVDEYTDVRAIQSKLKAAGARIEQEADPDGEGPAHFLVLDPDDNPILVDQHR